jgi:small-conductance mechanosensitive channel
MILGLSIAEWQEVGGSILLILATLVIGRWILRTLIPRTLQLIVRRTRTDLDDRLISAVFPSLYMLVVVLSLQVALSMLSFLPAVWESPLSDTFFVLYTLAGFLLLWRVVSTTLAWYATEVAPRTDTSLDEQIMPFLRRVSLIVVVLLLAIVLLSRFEVNVSGVVATLGVGSLAVALAAQETLSDTFASFVIMVDRPFRIGDRIEIQELETWGDVTDIGLRSTRIRTRDNRMVIVPNSLIGKNLIVNHSYPDTQYRIQIHIGLAYDADIERAREVIVEAVQEVDGVVKDRPVEALFLEFGEYALNFRVRWWIESYMDTRQIFDRVNSAIYHALNEAEVKIPFPEWILHHSFMDQSPPLRVATTGSERSGEGRPR